MRSLLFAMISLAILGMYGCSSSSSDSEVSAAESLEPKSFESCLSVYMPNGMTVTADGGAYIIGNGVMWYIREGKAVKVVTVSEMEPAKPVLQTDRERQLWALLQSEVKLRKKTEAALEAE